MTTASRAALMSTVKTWAMQIISAKMKLTGLSTTRDPEEIQLILLETLSKSPGESELGLILTKDLDILLKLQ